MTLTDDAAVTELLEQVADLSDHRVFLQRLIPQALALTDEAQATGAAHHLIRSGTFNAAGGPRRRP